MPPGYEPIWKERVEAIEAINPEDAAFSRFMRKQALDQQRDYYDTDGGTFEASSSAGWLEVDTEVLAASPDIVSVSIGAHYYQAGMSHPDGLGVNHIVWSRRLHRPLTQDDVFAVPPDRVLRLLARSRFDNLENLQNRTDPDGIPLPWDHASIGPTA